MLKPLVTAFTFAISSLPATSEQKNSFMDITPVRITACTKDGYAAETILRTHFETEDAEIKVQAQLLIVNHAISVMNHFRAEFAEVNLKSLSAETLVEKDFYTSILPQARTELEKSLSSLDPSARIEFVLDSESMAFNKDRSHCLSA